MKIKEWLFNFFHFNKQERNGVFIMCIILTLLFAFKLLIPIVFGDQHNVQFITVEVTNQNVVNDTLIETKANKFSKKYNNSLSQKLFVFNPNTITAEDAQRLGFSAKLSHTLLNYRNKGGKFFKSEDLKKLYGMPPKLYDQIESYILIPNIKVKKDSLTVKTEKVLTDKKVIAKKPVELNSADSLSIVYLKGVGPAFTKRIMKYRKMLGGFYSIHQLKEVYGMNDSLFNAISSQVLVNADAVDKIPINAIDINSLKSHPYFSYQSAHAIVNFRSKHGRLTESDFKSLGLFSDEKLKKIIPYLSF